MTEDPATGSATGAAAALLAELTNAADRELSFRFMEGVEMGRPSRFWRGCSRILVRQASSTSAGAVSAWGG